VSLAIEEDRDLVAPRDSGDGEGDRKAEGKLRVDPDGEEGPDELDGDGGVTVSMGDAVELLEAERSRISGNLGDAVLVLNDEYLKLVKFILYECFNTLCDTSSFRHQAWSGDCEVVKDNVEMCKY
jgi:hypothetical protein